MNRPQISIIVPVYKAEQFLSRCVDSVLAQTISGWELILVDDGSPDNSGELCDAYAQRDSRIRVIHQRNSGVSAARNRGILESTGTYIGFVDSDDWIAEDMYAQMLCAAESSGADIVMCDDLIVDEKDFTKLETIQELCGDCTLRKEMLSPDLMQEFAGAVWKCIYRADLIRKNGVSFPEGLRFSEDRVFNIYAMGYAECIQYIKKPLYMYYVNSEGCVRSFHKDFFHHAQYAAAEISRAVGLAWENCEEHQRAYLRQFIYNASLAIDNAKRTDATVSAAERMRMITEICRDQNLRRAMEQTGYYAHWGKWIHRRWILPIFFYRESVIRKLKNVREVFESGGFLGIVKRCAGKLFNKVQR